MPYALDAHDYRREDDKKKHSELTTQRWWIPWEGGVVGSGRGDGDYPTTQGTTGDQAPYLYF